MVLADTSTMLWTPSTSLHNAGGYQNVSSFEANCVNRTFFYYLFIYLFIYLFRKEKGPNPEWPSHIFWLRKLKVNGDVGVSDGSREPCDWWRGVSGGIEWWSREEFVFRLSPEGLAANFSSEELSVLSLTEGLQNPTLSTLSCSLKRGWREVWRASTMSQ